MSWLQWLEKMEGDLEQNGDPDPPVRGVNHVDDRRRAPAGSNEGHLDGHVAWVAGQKFFLQPKMFGGPTLYFYAGVE